MSIHYVHETFSSIKLRLPHQQKREHQRTPAGKRTESPRHGQGSEFQGKVDRSKRWNASPRTTFIELFLRDLIVLGYYGHACKDPSTDRQKKWHRRGGSCKKYRYFRPLLPMVLFSKGVYGRCPGRDVDTNVNSFRVNSSPSKTESSDQGEGTINSSACGSPTT